MSTDDSISEDVSTSGALSHCHVSPDGGKESETSLVSSEGTSASGLTVSGDRHTTSQTTGGTVQCRPMDNTPACKIRNICLSPDEAFEHGKNLPFINPSSLETLRALVQEIRSSGETDPEIWKDCEGRWLHLFQLVEKQYQEQILAQQEQYQCQIQLIQDEIKALVQIQNRQACVHPHTNLSTIPEAKSLTNTEDHIVPTISSQCYIPNDDNLAAPVDTPFSSPSPPLRGVEERATTVLSSGYGTLSAWETGIEPAESAGEDEEGSDSRDKQLWSSNRKEDTATTQCQQKFSSGRTLGVENVNQKIHQQRTSGTNQPLTSWAQRNKLRPKKNKTGAPHKPVEFHQQIQMESTYSLEQLQPVGLSSSSYPLKRSDSLVSEASGLTYWHLNENDLYHPLPDSFDSGAHLFFKEASMSLMPSSQLSLREIYQNKRGTDCKRLDWDGSIKSSPLSPQLDPTSTTRHSDHTSGFTSPSHFSSPSFSTQSQLCHTVDTSITPDSMVEGSPNPGDTDCISETSSVSAAGHSTLKVQGHWTIPSLCALHNKPQHAPLKSELEGSHTHPNTLKPLGVLNTQQMAGSSSVEDPVVLSLLRQNLREKHSRHVADLKAYYESEIQSLRDKLRLTDLPQDIEKNNQALSERCKHLEKALVDATSRIQELEANNSTLEKKLAEWSERYTVAGATVKSLQKRLEESKCSAKEKDSSAARLKTRIRQLEEAAQKACREADEKEARREREYKMLQDLLGEYDSLMKEHEGVKSNLVSTENKLVDAHDQISELKRIISKLESQVKQLEHENQARLRYSFHNNTQSSGAGLFHHPDLLLSPSKSKAEPDVTCIAPCPTNDQINSTIRSPFHQTSQSTTHKKSPYNLFNNKSSGSSVDTSAGGSWNDPEYEYELQSRHQEQSSEQREVSRRQGPGVMAPMMRALIELEETRATQSRAPWVDNSRTTVGFVERRLKEPVQEQVILQDVAKPERGLEKSRAISLLRAQRSLSPEGHRSSSLPPPAQRSVLPSTPSKREMLLMPLSAKSSPKRCPTENYSTAFAHMMPREVHLPHSSSPRKRLHFTSADSEQQPSETPGDVNPPDVNPQPCWEEQRGSLWDTCEDAGSSLLDRLHSLSEAERLFDELTQEKQQIEAALSRMPGAGGRVSLQTRLDEVALENRLERLNRELGSLRMTLKRFHVLRSSANI